MSYNQAGVGKKKNTTVKAHQRPKRGSRVRTHKRNTKMVKVYYGGGIHKMSAEKLAELRAQKKAKMNKRKSKGTDRILLGR